MGIGDEIMASGEAREYVKQNKKHVAFGNQERIFKSAILKFNPLIKTRIDSSEEIDLLDNYPGSRPYLNYELSTEKKVVFKKYTPIPGNILFSNDELKNAYAKIKPYLPFVFVEPSVKARFSSDNKDWGLENWHLLSDKIRSLTQIQPVHKFTTETLCSAVGIEVSSFRESSAILYFSSFFLSQEGGIHHAAAALKKRGVVIFGGFISPEITGYKNHVNIGDQQSELTPCGNLETCIHCRQAMQNIHPDEIAEIVLQQASRSMRHTTLVYRFAPGAKRVYLIWKQWKNIQTIKKLQKLLD